MENLLKIQDIIQVPLRDGKVIDLGWYRDRFLIHVVKDATPEDWDNPLERIDCGDDDTLVARTFLALMLKYGPGNFYSAEI